MHRLPVLLILWFSVFSIRAEAPLMIWVEFSDKNHSPYSLSHPSEFLSSRALERRQKQNIPLDFYDLPVSPIYTETLLSDSLVEILYTSRWFNGALLSVQGEASLIQLMEYEFINQVENVKPSPESLESKSESNVGGLQFARTETPDSVAHWHDYTAVFPYSFVHTLNNYPYYGAGSGQVSMLKGDVLHKNGYWGMGKVIALLDAGFRYVDSLEAFDYMWNHNRILGYKNFVAPGENVFEEHVHGAYVLSVMAAYLPGLFSGAALGASYWLLRTEDARSEFRIEEYNWLAGAEFADSVGADILNSSLGYTRFDDTSQDYTYDDLDGNTTVVARAANMAFSRGMLVVNSAGNYGSQNWRYIGSPADAHHAIAVGGTNAEGTRVGFSSIGPTPDGRIKPDIMAQGQGVAVINSFGSISNANGTSFAAPLISALAACLWQEFPYASNQEIKNAIIRSANRYFKPDNHYGFGIPDFELASALLKKQFEDPYFITLLHNPIMPESVIKFYNEKKGYVSLDLFNGSGQRIWSQENIAVNPGFNHIKPFSDFHQLTSGIYFIRVNFGHRSELLKAIKL